jgi:predicted deacetylase
VPDRTFLVSLHDVSPRHEGAVDRILSDLAAWGLPPALLLVVPDFHQAWPLEMHGGFVESLRNRSAAGHELCLHGRFHRELPEDGEVATGLAGAFRRRFLTAGEGEFLSLRGERLADRLDGARLTWETCALPDPDGFVPPAWLHSPELGPALWSRGFRWTENHAGFLTPRGTVRSPVITWASRDPLRRLGSRAFAPLALGTWRSEPRLRIALHPHDWDHPGLVASIRSTLRAAGRSRTAWRGRVADWVS